MYCAWHTVVTLQTSAVMVPVATELQVHSGPAQPQLFLWDPMNLASSSLSYMTAPVRVHTASWSCPLQKNTTLSP